MCVVYANDKSIHNACGETMRRQGGVGGPQQAIPRNQRYPELLPEATKVNIIKGTRKKLLTCWSTKHSPEWVGVKVGIPFVFRTVTCCWLRRTAYTVCNNVKTRVCCYHSASCAFYSREESTKFVMLNHAIKAYSSTQGINMYSEYIIDRPTTRTHHTAPYYGPTAGLSFRNHPGSSREQQG